MRERARDRVARIASSFDEQDADLVAADPLDFEGYGGQLEAARQETGLAEACVWGWADVDGERCALVCMDFGFLGGSMGVAVGEKVARAFDAATRRRLPVVSLCASGGARMQEGMAALVQMAKTAQARSAHAGAGLAHVSLLSSPVTGGVYASFASLADVVLAEPGATVGFAGPRVVAELTGTAPPTDVHTAEFAYEHGLVDALVAPADESRTIGHVLRNLTGRPAPGTRDRPSDDPAAEAGPVRSAWERLQLARHPQRPKAREILEVLLDDAFELRGDRLGSDDPAVVVRIGALQAGRRVLAVGQDASGDRRISASGFRKTIRCLRLAARHGLPVVTLVDTRGADPLPDSEGRGLAAAIAWTFVSMLECPTPTLAVVVGEGGSGGALAMACADRVLVWENAVFSVIAPEGAASILYRDASVAPELAERLRITAADLVELGFADAVLAEPPAGAQADPAGAVRALAARIAAGMDGLARAEPARRLAARNRRWREAGNRFLQQAPH